MTLTQFKPPTATETPRLDFSVLLSGLSLQPDLFSIRLALSRFGNVISMETYHVPFVNEESGISTFCQIFFESERSALEAAQQESLKINDKEIEIQLIEFDEQSEDEDSESLPQFADFLSQLSEPWCSAEFFGFNPPAIVSNALESQPSRIHKLGAQRVASGLQQMLETTVRREHSFQDREVHQKKTIGGTFSNLRFNVSLSTKLKKFE